MSAGGFLGEKLSPSQTSEILMNMCLSSLAGPGSCVEEMRAPATSWQSQLFMGQVGVSHCQLSRALPSTQHVRPDPSSRSDKYVHRFYAMSQETALLTAQGLLCRSPSPSRQFCYEILKHNPEVLDLLFRCAALPRPAWYPESQAASLASEVLVLLFHYPFEVVPGLSSPFEDVTLRDKADTEWKSMVDSLKIFTSRPNWVEDIIIVWDRINDENWQDIK